MSIRKGDKSQPFTLAAKPGETVDMPVFFYVDPEFLADRRMRGIDTMTLSYTFFRSADWDGETS